MFFNYVVNGFIGFGILILFFFDGILYFFFKYDKFEGNLVIKIFEIIDLKVDDVFFIIFLYVCIRLYKF